ncbi:MAG: ferritin-like domain-containing protein [Gemmatimonadaceae bacterium]
MSEKSRTTVVERPEHLYRVDTRREFLRMLGVGGTIVLLPSVFAACDNDNDSTGPGIGSASLNLSTDIGILNYAYALEQLEAAFYTAVVASAAFSGMNPEQKEVFTDLRSHEVAHREFLKAVLGTQAIGNLKLNDGTVATAVASTASILKNSEAFEDLGVSAYNGAGKYLQDAANLLFAGKIVSVEARHAASIRDLREGNNLAGTPPNTRFAGDDVVSSQGLDVKLEPSAVLTRVVATNFVSTMISIGTAPSITPATADAPPPPTP